jgi:hypothetical protein
MFHRMLGSVNVLADQTYIVLYGALFKANALTRKATVHILARASYCHTVTQTLQNCYSCGHDMRGG